MSARHTPGPWVVTQYPAIAPMVCAESTTGALRPICQGHSPSESEDIANARLIAAAPDLLDALRELLHSDQACTEAAAVQARWDVAADRRRKAVARARVLIGKVDG